MMEGLSAAEAVPKPVMFDVTYLKAHRTASSLLVEKGPRAADRSRQRRYGHQGSAEPVEGLHAVSHADGRPMSFLMTAGQISDYAGAAALIDDLPEAQWLFGDRGYDAA
jgi:hypothetical protein